jgi:hypothetical protein
MKARQWYRARIRWAEMVEGRGLRHWEEGHYLFCSEDRETAFRRALEIGEGGQSGGGFWCKRWKAQVASEDRPSQVITRRSRLPRFPEASSVGRAAFRL